MNFDYDTQRGPNEAQNLDISYVGWEVATFCKDVLIHCNHD